MKILNHIKKHDDRPDLAGEHRWGDLGQIILFVIFFAIWILDSFILKFSTFLSDNVSWFIRVPLSLIILILSSYLAKAGLKIVFGEEREKPIVLKEGIFSCVRHPIYLGAILLYLGLIILTFSLLSAGVWIIIIIFYIVISQYEEKILLQEFGEEYKKYMDEVPMLIPKFRNKK